MVSLGKFLGTLSRPDRLAPLLGVAAILLLAGCSSTRVAVNNAGQTEQLGAVQTGSVSTTALPPIGPNGEVQQGVPPLTQFIHPGGTPAAATLQVARSVARRAEREVIRLMAEEEVNLQAQVYLNRVSDLLFIMARAANARSGIGEELWHVKKRR